METVKVYKNGDWQYTHKFATDDEARKFFNDQCKLYLWYSPYGLMKSLHVTQDNSEVDNYVTELWFVCN